MPPVRDPRSVNQELAVTRRRLSCPGNCGMHPRVLFGKRHKPRERFYLFPGQGGRMYRRKQKRFMRWALAVALCFGSVLAAVLWWLSRPRLLLF